MCSKNWNFLIQTSFKRINWTFWNHILSKVEIKPIDYYNILFQHFMRRTRTSIISYTFYQPQSIATKRVLQSNQYDNWSVAHEKLWIIWRPYYLSEASQHNTNIAYIYGNRHRKCMLHAIEHIASHTRNHTNAKDTQSTFHNTYNINDL